MTKEPRSVQLRAYDHVMSHVRVIYMREHGHAHGAISEFAAALGVSRQAVDNWGKRIGVPRQYVARVAKLTGLPANAVRPRIVMVEIPPDIWKDIMDAIPGVENQVTFFPTEKSWQKALRKHRKSGEAAE